MGEKLAIGLFLSLENQINYIILHRLNDLIVQLNGQLKETW